MRKPLWGKNLDGSDFRAKSTLGVSIATLVFLTPFAVNNFLQGRVWLGFGCVAIVALFALKTWSISQGRYHPMLVFVGLVPLITGILFIALKEQGIVGALWCFPAVLSFYFMLPEKKAWLANLFLLAVTIPQAWQVLELPIATRVAGTLMLVSVFTTIFVRVIEHQQRKLEQQAVTDPLTGLLNRSLLNGTLEHAVKQGRRLGAPMTLVTLDIDHFKEINDTLGHDAGDQVLCRLSGLLSERFRSTDKVFRVGGEEFVALLFATDLQSAHKVAEELRDAVASATLLPGRKVTVSIGVATLSPEEDWNAWMKRSDEKLYRAKVDGRNRVVA